MSAAAKTKVKVKVEKEILAGSCYDNFINAIKSPATKQAYSNALRKYPNHMKLPYVEGPVCIGFFDSNFCI